MTDLKIEVDAAEVGLDAGRLARIDAHFAKYVDDGRLPGWLALVSRRGQIAHLSTYGRRDIANDLPVELDTVFRMYSMTKPVTSVAAMMLWEEGAFELKDPISRWLPEFNDMRVYTAGSAAAPATRPAMEPIRVWHLLTHTSGLTYGFHNSHPTDAIYRQRGYEWGSPAGVDLAGSCEAWASMPLTNDPGAEWNYVVSTDVLGRLVEVISGQTLDQFMAERIFTPLGMTDTGFFARPQQHDRLAELYVPHPATRQAHAMPQMGEGARAAPPFLSGGGGLVGTASDYHRFTQMLRGGGQVDGVRLLSPRTLAYMTRNHLPANADLTAFGRPLFSETTFDGVGFGLGFSVVIDPTANKVPSGLGTYAWGGAASTAFWVDPVEDITVLFLTQLLPSSTHPIRTQLQALVSQAIVA